MKIGSLTYLVRQERSLWRFKCEISILWQISWTTEMSLQHTTTWTATHCNMNCNTLQHELQHTATWTATHCNMNCNTLQLELQHELQHTATWTQNMSHKLQSLKFSCWALKHLLMYTRSHELERWVTNWRDESRAIVYTSTRVSVPFN